MVRPSSVMFRPSGVEYTPELCSDRKSCFGVSAVDSVEDELVSCIRSVLKNGRISDGIRKLRRSVSFSLNSVDEEEGSKKASIQSGSISEHSRQEVEDLSLVEEESEVLHLPSVALRRVNMTRRSCLARKASNLSPGSSVITPTHSTSPRRRFSPVNSFSRLQSKGIMGSVTPRRSSFSLDSSPTRMSSVSCMKSRFYRLDSNAHAHVGGPHVSRNAERTGLILLFATWAALHSAYLVLT